MDWKYVNGMDLYVLFQEGEFDVRVKSIEAVMDAQSFASPGISIQSMDEIGKLIEATIKSGGKLYDYDYKELCIAIYRSTLNTILEATVVDEDGDNENDLNANDDDAAQLSTIQGMICQGLQRADAQSSSKVNVAWTLRYTFDAVLEEMDMKEKVQGNSSWRPDVQTAKLYTCNGVTSGSGAYVVGSLPPTQAPSVTATEIVRTMKPTTISPLSISLVAIPPSEKTTTLDPPSSMPTKMIITSTTNMPNPATASTLSPSNSPIMPMIDMNPSPSASIDDTKETPTGQTLILPASVDSDENSMNENKSMIDSSSSSVSISLNVGIISVLVYVICATGR